MDIIKNSKNNFFSDNIWRTGEKKKRLMKSFHAGNLVNEDEGDMETPGLSE